MRLTIKAKLAGTFIVVVLLAAGAMFAAIMALGNLDASFNEALSSNVKRIALAEDVDNRSLQVAQDGSAKQPVQAPQLKTLADVKGRALMIHAGGDNYADQPAPLGGGGARIACGVIGG